MDPTMQSENMRRFEGLKRIYHIKEGLYTSQTGQILGGVKHHVRCVNYQIIIRLQTVKFRITTNLIAVTKLRTIFTSCDRR